MNDLDRKYSRELWTLTAIFAVMGAVAILGVAVAYFVCG